ncbi:MAG: hypothetical protein LIP77_04195 [Planctomycetes bacterium]|nr:hypothetical protein [Planctomycetota bacterium]
MDTVMKRIEHLSRLAAARPDPLPLDVARIMPCIRGQEIVDESLTLPLGFLTGGVAAAAAAAVVVSLFGLTAWMEMANPYPVVESLLDVMDLMV